MVEDKKAGDKKAGDKKPVTDRTYPMGDAGREMQDREMQGDAGQEMQDRRNNPQ
jgi:hypothetical protein